MNCFRSDMHADRRTVLRLEVLEKLSRPLVPSSNSTPQKPKEGCFNLGQGPLPTILDIITLTRRKPSTPKHYQRVNDYNQQHQISPKADYATFRLSLDSDAQSVSILIKLCLDVL
jgi:hypothetical protein